MSPRSVNRVPWIVLALVLTPVTSQAAFISATNVSVSGGAVSGPLSNLNNNVYPVEGSSFNDAAFTVSWSGTGPVFVFDFFNLYNVTDVMLSVDNNDALRVEYSTNNVSYTTLFTIQTTFGEIGGGMDTMSTKFGDPEYVSGIDFAPVQARYLRVQALSGDNLFAIGEVQIEGTVVPAPPSIALLGVGAVGLLGYRRLRKTPVHATA